MLNGNDSASTRITVPVGMGPLLRRKPASAYLLERHGVVRSPHTLAKYATTGGGPKYRKDGKFPVYDPADLDAYASSVLSPLVSSSSELKSITSEVVA